jgi:alpha-glucosidase (family GH31 glycosyl hydrolase)
MGQKFNPVADPASVVTVGNARFTFLTPRVVRMEWSADGEAAGFEDRASFAFVNRKLPAPKIDVRRDKGTTTITAGAITLTYRDGAELSGSGALKVTFSVGGKAVDWTPASKPSANLKGTVRTLDGVSGSCELEPGLLSRDGWVLVDDSDRLLLDGTNTDWPWATPRRHVTDPKKPKAVDWYLFCHGDDYAGALADFTLVAGKIPLPPKYALGSWWSRYWAYSDTELKGIVAQFNEHDVPLDVLVIDMDWHLDGWTGYTWNKDYFPDSAAFLKWCKDNHLFVTLNLHPADGVGKHEAQFPAFKAAMGIKDKTCYRVPFDCTDRTFIENYFSLLHHPEEAKGVDFWWMDWQQGTNTKIPGLDPLYWLNYLHWTDFERRSKQGLSLGGTASGGTGFQPVQSGAPNNSTSVRTGWKPVPPQSNSYGDKRPLIFSRWGGLGNHRYQIGFSGDTYNNWESLAFQPYFTATAANVGYGYWSHDIGGHQPGPVAPELYARWIQYGVFSPILRTHCGKRPDAERRIWAFPDEVFNACRDAFLLRYAMIPYTYTACRKAYDTGVSLCRPLYYGWPTEEAAYANPDQYMFGDDLMIAPVVSPANSVSEVASADVWFPPAQGGWTEWASGRVYGGDGGLTRRLSYALRDIPVFARAGAVIPMQPKMARTGEKPVDPLILTVFDGGPKGAASGETTVYEDDGITSGYERGEHCVTRVTHSLVSGVRTVEIHPAEGAYEGMLTERAHEVRLAFVLPPESVKIDGVTVPKAAGPNEGAWWYDAHTATLFARSKKASVRQRVKVEIALSKVDDSPIRSGLIGQLGVLDDVLKILGKTAPESIREGAAIRGGIANDPAGAMARGAALQADWWRMLEEINACPAPEAARQKAQARLLGLACDVTLKGDSTGKIVAEAHVAFAPRFDRHQDVGVSVEFSVPGGASGGWSLGAGNGTSARLALGSGLTARGVLSSAGVPSLGTVQTRVVIDPGAGGPGGGTDHVSKITISMSESFCPSINAWRVLGSFDGPQEDEIRTAHIDESAPVDLKRSYKGIGGTLISWKAVRRTIDPKDDPRKEFFVDLHKAFGKEHDDAVAYAVTWIESDSDRKVTLALGSDDGAAAWVNGVEVFRKYVQRGYASRDDRFEIALKKGRNEVLLKIGQAKGAWGFGVFIEDADGRAVPGVRVVE